jgi:hypothetical protein
VSIASFQGKQPEKLAILARVLNACRTRIGTVEGINMTDVLGRDKLVQDARKRLKL